jgi:predicted double-glycine peptidase
MRRSRVHSPAVRPGAVFLAAAALALVAACALHRPPAEELFVHDDTTVEVPSSLIPVPLVPQETPFSCGDAVVLALLRFYEPGRYDHVLEASLYSPLRTTSEDGTEPASMTAYLGHEPGLSAKTRWSTPSSYVSLDEIERAIDRGEPPIVAIQAWQSVRDDKDLRPWAEDWDDGHYVVVVAYDSNRIYFMDPSTEHRYAYVLLPEFMDRWHDVLGRAKVHAQHIAIFVVSSGNSRREGVTRVVPRRASAVH